MKTTEWISFNERLPKDYQRVIWFDKRGGDIEIGYFVPSQSKIPEYATHWKPLPEPPKKQS